jgi:hypothetical protein
MRRHGRANALWGERAGCLTRCHRRPRRLCVRRLLRCRHYTRNALQGGMGGSKRNRNQRSSPTAIDPRGKSGRRERGKPRTLKRVAPFARSSPELALRCRKPKDHSAFAREMGLSCEPSATRLSRCTEVRRASPAKIELPANARLPQAPSEAN